MERRGRVDQGKAERWRQQVRDHPIADGGTRVCAACCGRFPCPERLAAVECLVTAGLAVPTDTTVQPQPPAALPPDEPTGAP